MLKACDTISKELEERLQYFKDETKLLEYERLDQRTRHDVEMLREVGMCPGTISITSPRTLKVPLVCSISFL